jgi:hypothetical protein
VSDSGTLVKTRFDPLQLDVCLPCSRTFFPAGFPLLLVTNSPDILEALAETWGHYQQEFDRPPIRMQVLVQEDGEVTGAPNHRASGHLYAVVSDPFNFAVADLRELSCAIYLSAKTAADHPLARWFYLESMAYMLLAQRYLVPVHAACIARGDSGLMLCGASGAGKSTLSFACARAGWTYVSDDCVWLLPGDGKRHAIGRAHQARLREDAALLFPEVAGHLPRSNPNGKLSLEVPMDAYPHHPRCTVDGLVFLERSAGAVPRLQRIPSAEAVDLLLADSPFYGDEVQERHERAVRQFLEVPAWRLYYETLDDGMRLLAELRPGPNPK